MNILRYEYNFNDFDLVNLSQNYLHNKLNKTEIQTARKYNFFNDINKMTFIQI